MIDLNLPQSIGVLPIENIQVVTPTEILHAFGQHPDANTLPANKLQFACILIDDQAPVFPSVGQAAEGNTPPPPNK